jgi:hypothetical protein
MFGSVVAVNPMTAALPVIECEPVVDGRSQRLGFDHGVVPTGTVGTTRAAAVP